MPEGYKVVAINQENAGQLVRSLRNERADSDKNSWALCRACASSEDETLWVLAHTDQGVTWGIIEATRTRLSTNAIARWPTPEIDETSIQQLRVFGALGEVLIWRDEDTRALNGRLLTDDDSVSVGWVAPRSGIRVIAASRVADGGTTTNGFTAVAEGNGRTHVVPWALLEDDFESRGIVGAYPLVLRVKEYFKLDRDSGCVRISASRLVALARKEW